MDEMQSYNKCHWYYKMVIMIYLKLLTNINNITKNRYIKYDRIVNIYIIVRDVGVYVGVPTIAAMLITIQTVASSTGTRVLVALDHTYLRTSVSVTRTRVQSCNDVVIIVVCVEIVILNYRIYK